MDRIGKYEIQGEIGRGGFGKVYRGFDPQVRRLVAIKILSGDTDPSAVGRFRIEATAAGNLLHKNIVTVYEFAQDAGLQFLVMEYLEGEDLQRVISSRRPLNLLTKVRIMHDVADGLRCAHRHGVVHRDVKPANIMLLSDGNVKIMDFGIARLTTEDATRLTMEGLIMGSLSYMAPEQFQNGTVDELSDIWSYGCVFYELLAGVGPFHARDTPSVLYKITSHTPQPVTELVEGCPAELDTILLKLLSRDREQRYQTFEDVQFYLDSVLLELQKQEARMLFGQAKEYRAANQFEKAEALIGQVLDFDRGNTEVRQFREELREKIRILRLARPKVEALLAKAEEAFAKGDYSSACEHAKTALQLDPSSSRAQTRLREALEAKERCERANRLLQEAEQCLQNSELTAAFEKASEAQRAEPANARAANLLAGIQREIQVRERQREIRDALNKARGLIVTGALDDAVQMLTALRSVYPESAEVSALCDRTVREKAAQEARRRLAAGTKSIRELLRAGRLVAAQAELEELKRDFPDDGEVQSMLTYVRETLEEQRRKEAAEKIGRDALALANGKKFDQALSLLNLAMREYPADERMTRLMQQVSSLKAKDEEERDVSQTLARFDQFRNSGKLAEAGQLVSGLLQRYPQNEKVIGAQAQLRASIEEANARQQAELLKKRLGQADEALERGQPEQAVGLLEELAKTHPGRVEIGSKLEIARRAQQEQQDRREVEKVLQKVRDLEALGKLTEARNLLDPALRSHPAAADLRQTVQRLDASIAEVQHREALAAIARSVEEPLRRQDWKLCFDRLAEAEKRFPQEPALRDLRSRVAHEERAALEQFRKQIQDAMARQDWRYCSQRLGEAAEKFPDNPDVPALRQRVEKEQRRIALAQATQDVESAISRQDWTFCNSRLNELANSYPGEPALQGLRAKIADEQRKLEEARLRTMDAAASTIADGIQRRDWGFCSQKLDELEHRYPADSALRELRTRVSLARQKEEKEQEQRRALSAISQTVESAIERRDWASCLNALSAAELQFPNEARLRELRDTLTRAQQQEQEESRRVQTLAEISASIEADFARGNWDACHERLTKAERQFPGDPTLRQLSDKVHREQFRAEIVQAIQSHDWEFCERRLAEADTRWPREGFVGELRSKAALERKAEQEERRRHQAFTTAVKAIEEGIRRRDWRSCRESLADADRQFPSHPTIETLRAKVSAEQEWDEAERQRKENLDKIVKEVEAAIKRRDWRFCLLMLGEAEKEHSNEPALRRLRAKVASEQQQEEEENHLRVMAELSACIEQGLGRQDLAACEKQLRDAEQRYPGEPALRTLRAKVNLEKNRQEDEKRLQALAEIAKAVESGISARDWAGCQAKLEDADRRYPAEPSLRSLRAKVALERQRLEEERRLAALGAIIQAVEACAVRRDWASCLAQLAIAEKQHPGDPSISNLRTRAETEQRRDEDARRRAELDSAVAAIEEVICLRDWDSCWSRLREADQRFPGEAALQALRARVEHEQSRDEAARRLKEVDDLCARVSDAIVREEWVRASELIQAGLQQLPGHAVLLKLREQLKTARERRQTLTEAELHLSKQRPAEAETALRALLAKQPNDPEAKALLASVQQQKEREDLQRQRAAGRKELDDLLRVRDYDKAIQRASALLKTFPGDSGLEESLKSATAAKELHQQRVRTGEAIAKIERLFQKGKAEEVRKEAAAVLAIQEEPRARELLDWAEAAIQRREQAAKLPLVEPPVTPIRRSNLKWAMIAAAVVGVGVVVGLAMRPTSEPPVSHAENAGTHPTGTIDKPVVLLGAVEPGALTFLQSTAKAPKAQSLKVGGVGAEFSATASDPWIRVNPRSGKGPATLIVEVDSAALENGHYSGYVTVSGADQHSKAVPVTLTLSKPGAAVPVKQKPTSETASLDHVQPKIPNVEHPITEPKVPDPTPAPVSVCAANGGEGAVTPPAVYAGALSGRGFWTGTLPATCTVALAGGRAAFGSLSKPLPLTGATFNVTTPGVTIVEAGVGRLVVKNNSGQTLTRIDFSWRVNTP